MTGTMNDEKQATIDSLTLECREKAWQLRNTLLTRLSLSGVGSDESPIPPPQPPLDAIIETLRDTSATLTAISTFLSQEVFPKIR